MNDDDYDERTNEKKYRNEMFLMNRSELLHLKKYIYDLPWLLLCWTFLAEDFYFARARARQFALKR